MVKDRKEKRLLFSVTRKDCDWQYFRAGGKGGQNVNKVSSGVRCIHKESGATGRAVDTRDQFRNRQLAFTRMLETKEFRNWHKIEVARRLGKLKTEEQLEDEINDAVDAQMTPDKLLIEPKYVCASCRHESKYEELDSYKGTFSCPECGEICD